MHVNIKRWGCLRDGDRILTATATISPKEINPENSLEGLILKLKHQYFGHLMQRAHSLKKILMLGKIEGRKRRG